MRFTISILLILLLASCGSKKKTIDVEIEKNRVENNFHQRRVDSLIREIEKRNILLQLAIEPVDPKEPNEANFISGKDTIKFHGKNSKVNIKKKETDSIAKTSHTTTTETEDKGTFESSSKKKNVNLEKEGNAGQWVWIVWGLVILVFLIWMLLNKRRTI